jgi:hypothetical protein
MVFASWADIERLVQGMHAEQRRLRMAIDSRRTIGRDETVAELFNKWQLSECTHMFGAQGYALHASERDLKKLLASMKSVQKRRFVRKLSKYRWLPSTINLE